MKCATETAGALHQSAYDELVFKQRKVVATLTTATLAPYVAFILIAAFYPNILAIKISSSSVINVAWPLGVAFIVGSWLLTGLYIIRANGELDALVSAVRSEANV